MNSGEICHYAKMFMGAGEGKIAEMIQQEQGAAGTSQAGVVQAGTSQTRTSQAGTSQAGVVQAGTSQTRTSQGRNKPGRNRPGQKQVGQGMAWSPQQERTHQKRLRISDYEMFGLSSRIQVYHYCFRS